MGTFVKVAGTKGLIPRTQRDAFKVAVVLAKEVLTGRITRKTARRVIARVKPDFSLRLAEDIVRAAVETKRELGGSHVPGHTATRRGGRR